MLNNEPTGLHIERGIKCFRYRTEMNSSAVARSFVTILNIRVNKRVNDFTVDLSSRLVSRYSDRFTLCLLL